MELLIAVLIVGGGGVLAKLFFWGAILSLFNDTPESSARAWQRDRERERLRLEALAKREAALQRWRERPSWRERLRHWH